MEQTNVGPLPVRGMDKGFWACVWKDRGATGRVKLCGLGHIQLKLALSIESFSKHHGEKGLLLSTAFILESYEKRDNWLCRDRLRGIQANAEEVPRKAWFGPSKCMGDADSKTSRD